MRSGLQMGEMIMSDRIIEMKDLSYAYTAAEGDAHAARRPTAA